MTKVIDELTKACVSFVIKRLGKRFFLLRCGKSL
jgi:hypothetical protein